MSPFTRAALALAGFSLLVAHLGCDAIFGLDEVFPVSANQSSATSTSTSTNAGTGGGAGGGTGGGAGGGAECPLVPVPGNLLTGTWQTTQIAGVTSLDQSVMTPIDLGGSLTLSITYSGTAAADATLQLVANGQSVGTAPLKGTVHGDSTVAGPLPFDVTDPRWTGNAMSVQILDSTGVEVQCASLLYAAPPGTEVLEDGFLDQGPGQWFADNGAMGGWDATHGLCGPGAMEVIVPALSDLAELRSGQEDGPWETGTTFFYGAALSPMSGFAEALGLELVLHVQYVDSDLDSDTATNTSSTNGWLAATGSFKVAQPVANVALYVEAPSSANQDTTFLGDCFSIRAVSP